MIYKCKTEFYVDRIDDYKKVEKESLVKENTRWVYKYAREGNVRLERPTRCSRKSTLKEIVIPDWYLRLYFDVELPAAPEG